MLLLCLLQFAVVDVPERESNTVVSQTWRDASVWTEETPVPGRLIGLYGIYWKWLVAAGNFRMWKTPSSSLWLLVCWHKSHSRHKMRWAHPGPTRRVLYDWRAHIIEAFMLFFYGRKLKRNSSVARSDMLSHFGHWPLAFVTIVPFTPLLRVLTDFAAFLYNRHADVSGNSFTQS